MLRSLALLAALALPGFAAAQAAVAAPRQGTDYDLITPAQAPFASGPKIEVAEVFSYHCPACAEFQPFFSRWKARMPADVRVTYVHAAFGGAIDNLARGFFAAETLGASERTHEAFFKAFHIDRKITTGSIAEVADVYAGLGLDRKRVLDTMNSFGVTSKVNRAKQFAQRTGVNGTPTVVINGKYRVYLTRDRGGEGMLQTIDALLARERASRPASPAPAARPAAAAR
ncbi:thiol:disulfide interchange protein DsbA/DsbL [Silanimonas sp.]|jgi:thiol:disulfide interchange protein DsbA|uniref:thiol:disulfide interchange protein DsbA/DsbL n=1 Tax=Silanimonas sp. TaxID=1929290 RepID=UPI0022BE14AE|nr:thiol:disulfide interchange protein DsbA/DsbL [Silanimonas sp.]MCZ8164924.1 thiol:disulfide interchange protein DsbA/DsbL [Silanimonas sp.]